MSQTSPSEGGSTRVVRRRTAFALPLALAAGSTLVRPWRAGADTGRWSAERARRWYRAQGWLVGANYIPSSAVNQLEMWQADTFDPALIDRELLLARVIGFNSVRVFLHDQLWTQDRAGFKRRIARFVAIAAQRRIKPLFVFFDSCWDPHPQLGRQPDPRPGICGSGWVQSPGAERLGDRSYRMVMRNYLVDIMTEFRSDPRVLGWDVWNEPDNPATQYRSVERSDKAELVEELLPQVFQWARTVEATQPLTSGVWDGEWADPQRRSATCQIQLDNSDVISFHSYAKPAEFDERIDELTSHERPILCTEYLARSYGSTVEGVLPIAKKRQVGAYNWGLVAGKTQTYLPWDSWNRPYAEPPHPWFSDLLHADGSPYRSREIACIRKLNNRPIGESLFPPG